MSWTLWSVEDVVWSLDVEDLDERLDGVEWEEVDEDGRTLLHVAVAHGAVLLVRGLLRRLRVGEVGMAVERRDEGGFSPIHTACLCGSAEILGELLAGVPAEMVRLVASAEVRNPTRKTPLHCLAKRGSKVMVDMLVDAGAPVDARDAWGSTPLMRASAVGNADVVVALVAAGADCAVADTTSGDTALHLACEGEHRKVVEILVRQNRSLLGIENREGLTPKAFTDETGR
uniref:Uncharacterized protein n=1 Tax=Compsopogon caeruleus TaxID=31354 RepID=A0A6T6CY87_9RHOD|mmetsp:Transcript_9072/g.18358  ORF Transcript_9072/g.18358 Transcript_9072/m.18358 type:complete len:230 (+) Transcript_9072:129-818(+)|eukprot:CAMPEP_0184684908 /NCGR_PEP_ID=MMETSP0312-20130426/17089_1 /TAXON_ID=31354 /ORGANISM="Compsopogon coeruleus, Strain SAG 36.94" /LENGTH=229 /DNA_ID=CAMNT_0027138545 /DNA_START=120 /DNA_END=809 /DNA_ORIENTATION=-